MDVDASPKRNTLFIASSLAVALPRIGIDLAIDAISLSWVERAYLLSAAAFLVPMGRVSDIYGRKKVFLCGMTIGSITSVLAALSASGTGLIV